MMNQFSITTILVLLCLYSKGIEPAIVKLAPISTNEVVNHTYFNLGYSEENEQASWVFYRLTPDYFVGVDRTEDFRADPAVSTGSASLADYKGSGYDRGHLCPAADMKLNETSISETFFLSNMSPQNASFNRGIWSKLESLVRDWCQIQDTLYIATGPVFKDNIGTIGANQVTVPGYFYKAVIDGAQKKGIAFVLPNEKSSAELSSFVITIDSLEQLTGIDFFAGLPDSIENELERQTDYSKWSVKEPEIKVAVNSALDGDIKIYPSTTDHFVYVQSSSDALKLNVYSVAGVSVFQSNLTRGTNTVDLSSFAKGIYLMHITGLNADIKKKIIKE